MLTEEQIYPLLDKYAKPLPRYTSYPTAVELTDTFDMDDVKGAIAESVELPLSLYVHLPFCKSLCYFCACHKIITSKEDDKEIYVKNLRREAQTIASLTDSPISLSHLHLGGGSPSYMSNSQLAEVIEITNSYFSPTPRIQRSVELDPRTTNRDQLELFCKAGFRRGSLGVQDFDDTVQKLVHRIQSVELVRDVVQEMKRSGFEEINFDLIYGLPGQTKESISDTVEKVIDLRPDRLALYGYAHVSGKAKQQKTLEKYDLPDTTERISLFFTAKRLLEEAGYVWIGFDHFALPNDDLARHQKKGTLRRNFMGYTTSAGRGVLGLGVSAISDLSSIMFQVTPHLEQYAELVSSGSLPYWRAASRTRRDQRRAKVIEQILCNLHVDWSKFKGYQEDILGPSEEDRLVELEKDGLIELELDGFRVTERGRMFLRSIASVFDEYLPTARERGKGGFSAAI